MRRNRVIFRSVNFSSREFLKRIALDCANTLLSVTEMALPSHQSTHSKPGGRVSLDASVSPIFHSQSIAKSTPLHLKSLWNPPPSPHPHHHHSSPSGHHLLPGLRRSTDFLPPMASLQTHCLPFIYFLHISLLLPTRDPAQAGPVVCTSPPSPCSPFRHLQKPALPIRSRSNPPGHSSQAPRGPRPSPLSTHHSRSPTLVGDDSRVSLQLHGELHAGRDHPSNVQVLSILSQVESMIPSPSPPSLELNL